MSRKVLQFLHRISTPSGVKRKSSLPSSLHRIGLDSGVDLSVITFQYDLRNKLAFASIIPYLATIGANDN